MFLATKEDSERRGRARPVHQDNEEGGIEVCCTVYVKCRGMLVCGTSDHLDF